MVPLEVDSLADSEGVYTIEFNVESENEFSELVSEEEDKHKITTKLIFNIYSGGYLISPQTLDYADFYIWSDLNEREDWLKCEVEDGYYVLYLDNVESKQYEWSGVLYYNNEEIPDGTESDIWNYKVNSGDTIDGSWSEDNVFTMDEAYFEDDTNIITIGFNIRSGYSLLSSILPESGYVISRAGESFTLSLDLTYGGYSVTCPDFGKFYIIGGWHLSDEGAWDEWEQLTYNESTGLYETTFNTSDVIYASTYEYKIVFVHDDQNYDWWTNELTSTNRYVTFSWTESETFSHTDSCSLDVDVSQFHTLAMDESNLTVYFNITSWGDDYSTSYEYSLYAAGSWDGETWGFYECTYDDTHSAGNVLFYRVALPITSAGNYEFKIILCKTNSPSWPSGSGSNNGYIVEGDGGANASMTVSETDITYGYSLQYFYVDGGSGNYQ